LKIGETRNYENQREVYEYLGESSCLIIRVELVGSDLFFLEEVSEVTPLVRKENSAGVTQWATKIENRTTGGFAVTSDGQYVYVRIFRLSDNIPYIIKLNGISGTLISSIKG
jgi:hypothetical protein